MKLSVKLTFGDKNIEFLFRKKFNFKISRNKPNKYIDNEKYIYIYMPFFVIKYTHTNYNKIIHVLIDEYVKSYYETHNRNVDVFICILKKYIKHETLLKPSFNFNYSISENNTYKFYLTIEKGWLIKHNLGVLENIVYPDCYMTPEKINRLFPKFDKSKTNIINYIENGDT